MTIYQSSASTTQLGRVFELSFPELLYINTWPILNVLESFPSTEQELSFSDDKTNKHKITVKIDV
jgi:hypothetical protein